MRQLDLVHNVITMTLKRELALCDRLAELAPEFGVEAIDVMPGEEDGRATPQAIDRLLVPERRAAILGFLDVWLPLFRQTRESLGSDLEQ